MDPTPTPTTCGRSLVGHAACHAGCMGCMGCRPFNAKRVVVIDDLADIVDSTVMFLAAVGHHAFGATEGAAGFGLAVEQDAEVVVLDFQMPNMDGGDVGEALRGHAVTEKVKIVMVSATPEKTVRASFAGYDAFLVKPVKPALLLETIASLA